MDVTIIVPSEILDTFLSAAPTATVSEADDGSALGLGQSATVFMAVTEVWKWAKEICKKLVPFIESKPEMEFIMEGPGGKVSIKLKNVSEQLIKESAEKVMRVSKTSKMTEKPEKRRGKAKKVMK
jgi:hypothetical protein